MLLGRRQKSVSVQTDHTSPEPCERRSLTVASLVKLFVSIEDQVEQAKQKYLVGDFDELVNHIKLSLESFFRFFHRRSPRIV